MDVFTELNTDGFNATELDMLNTAHAVLIERHPGIDADTIADFLNNAFIPGITENGLVEAVEAHI